MTTHSLWYPSLLKFGGSKLLPAHCDAWLVQFLLISCLTFRQGHIISLLEIWGESAAKDPLLNSNNFEQKKIMKSEQPYWLHFSSVARDESPAERSSSNFVWKIIDKFRAHLSSLCRKWTSIFPFWKKGKWGTTRLCPFKSDFPSSWIWSAAHHHHRWLKGAATQCCNTVNSRYIVALER